MYRVNRVKLAVTVVACAGVTQFLVAAAVAIAHYPGGYSFCGDFLSDLGKSRATPWAGELPCSALFNTSIIVLGASLIPFFAAVPSTLNAGALAGRLYATCGMVSAAGLIGIGLTPYDLFFIAHNVALALWIGPMLVLVVAYLATASHDGTTSRGLVACTVALAAAVSLYAAAGSRPGYVTMQKATVLLSMGWFLLIAWRVVRTAVECVARRNVVVKREAQWYAAYLERGHWRRSRPS